RDAIVIQWSLVAALVALWLGFHRRWGALGLELRLTPGLTGVVLGMLLIVVLLLRQRAEVIRDREMLTALRRRMDKLEVMLPHTSDEFRRFAWLAVTAGVCEELLYRGFMIAYLSNWMDVLPAAAVSSVIFSIGHSYQG